MITFWTKLDTDKGAGYDRIFESMSADVAAMSNRC